MDNAEEEYKLFITKALIPDEEYITDQHCLLHSTVSQTSVFEEWDLGRRQFLA